MNTLLVLHGPNLNLLGTREPQLYGADSLGDIDTRLQALGRETGCRVQCFQSNAEHGLLERIHLAAAEGTDFIVFNPAAFTHTSIALRDALLAAAVPFIEVHLSNVYQREPFRQRSYFSDIAIGVISGFGAMSYELAIRAAVDYLASR